MSSRGRRLHYPSRINVAPSPVIVRSMSNPKPGWKLADAVDLVRQGYSVAHPARVSGWVAGVIEAELKIDNHTELSRWLTSSAATNRRVLDSDKLPSTTFIKPHVLFST